MYVCTHIYVWIYQAISIYEYIHTCIYMYVHVYTFMYMYLHVCTCMYVYVRVCTCMYVYGMTVTVSHKTVSIVPTLNVGISVSTILTWHNLSCCHAYNTQVWYVLFYT